VFWRGSIFGSF
jgi:hypothetical protein